MGPMCCCEVVLPIFFLFNLHNAWVMRKNVGVCWLHGESSEGRKRFQECLEGDAEHLEIDERVMDGQGSLASPGLPWQHYCAG